MMGFYKDTFRRNVSTSNFSCLNRISDETEVTIWHTTGYLRGVLVAIETKHTDEVTEMA